MKYIKSYTQHHESIRSKMAGIGLAGALLTGSPEAVAKNEPGTESTQLESYQLAKNQVEYISKFRSLDPQKDSILSDILFEIQQNLDSKDPEKFVELYEKLISHLETKYDYKIQQTKIEEKFVSSGISDKVMNLSFFEILGWLGSICLAICGIPQAWQSYKEKNSDGISWGFILLWTFGEIFALAYVYDKLDAPLVMNYASNLLILGIILYFKINPTKTFEDPQHT